MHRKLKTKWWKRRSRAAADRRVMTTGPDPPDGSGRVGGAPEGRFDGHGEEHPLHAALSPIRHAEHPESIVGDPRERISPHRRRERGGCAGRFPSLHRCGHGLFPFLRHSTWKPSSASTRWSPAKCCWFPAESPIARLGRHDSLRIFCHSHEAVDYVTNEDQYTCANQLRAHPRCGSDLDRLWGSVCICERAGHGAHALLG